MTCTCKIVDKPVGNCIGCGRPTASVYSRNDVKQYACDLGCFWLADLHAAVKYYGFLSNPARLYGVED